MSLHENIYEKQAIKAELVEVASSVPTREVRLQCQISQVLACSSVGVFFFGGGGAHCSLVIVGYAIVVDVVGVTVDAVVCVQSSMFVSLLCVCVFQLRFLCLCCSSVHYLFSLSLSLSCFLFGFVFFFLLVCLSLSFCFLCHIVALLPFYCFGLFEFLMLSKKRYIYICICASAVELLTGPRLGVLIVINWFKFAFVQNIVCQKPIKIGVSAHFACTKKMCAQILIVINWSELACFVGPKLRRPVNNPCLDQFITLTWTS